MGGHPRPPLRGRRLKDDEEWLWREAMRGVKAFRKLETTPDKIPTTKSERKVQIAKLVPVPAVPHRPIAPPPTAIGSGVDGGTARRLAQGRIEPDARLDLHGMTQDHAHAALERFLAASIALGRRCVLVITGKGGPSKTALDDNAVWARRRPGVLKSLVPLWLEHSALRGRIASMRPAHFRHGGEGAIYIYLRSAN